MAQIGIAAFTARGRALAGRLRQLLEPEYETELYKKELRQWCGRQFSLQKEAIIFIGACGIAVRSIAPFLKSKTTDPAVLVMDEAGQYVISLLSGHIGGANRLARLVSSLTGAVPVITTATDVNEKFAVDVFARENCLAIGSMKAAREISAAVLDGETVGLFCEGPVSGMVPPELKLLRAGEIPGGGETEGEKSGGHTEKIRRLICISRETPERLFSGCSFETVLHLRPRPFVLGIGCRRGRPEEAIGSEISEVLQRLGISLEEVGAVASIDLKAGEPGLLGFCRKYRLDFVTYPAAVLKKMEGDFTASSFVKETTGVDNVCERAALCLAGAGGRLLQKKTGKNGVTVAVAVRDWSVCFEK